MAIFKIVGQALRITREGKRYVHSIMYLRAKNKDEAEVKALNLGVPNPVAAFFSADNNPYCEAVK